MKHYDLIVCDFPANLFLEMAKQVGIDYVWSGFAYGTDQQKLNEAMDYIRYEPSMLKTNSMIPMTIFAVPKELDEEPEVFRGNQTHYIYCIPLDKETLQKKINKIKTLGVFL